jgi:hypothetical protein
VIPGNICQTITEMSFEQFSESQMLKLSHSIEKGVRIILSFDYSNHIAEQSDRNKRQRL